MSSLDQDNLFDLRCIVPVFRNSSYPPNKEELMAPFSISTVKVLPAACPNAWPEPVQRVQFLAESGLQEVPPRYIRSPLERPGGREILSNDHIPIVDLSHLEEDSRRKDCLALIEQACEQWGFFQVINHGIPLQFLKSVKAVAGDFFELPMEEKQIYANNPSSYEGYGSRLGVEKGVILDWGDYYFVNLLPESQRDMSKWPTNPVLWRETMEKYTQHIMSVCNKLLAAFSTNLGLSSCEKLSQAFGDYDVGMRINYYPICPQPDLTLGLSSHSDPGGLTILLQDDRVPGLQVRHNGGWTMVKPVPGALVVNVGDQLQILTNDRYKSVEHRAVVNRSSDRLSIACFLNPANDMLVAPLQELCERSGKKPLYNAMTFKQYRSFIRRKGTNGKGHLNSISSPKTY